MFQVKRIYDAPAQADGFRVLVDRLWPRGLSKEKAHVDLWLRDVAPSDALRKWFAHDPAKWAGFQRRYRVELRARRLLLKQLRALERQHGCVTLLFAAHDAEHSNAAALAKMLRHL